ncbi:flagellar hook protein FlgE [Colwellia sp. Bg11-28]|uniref:flagellar hook protein FlgE n=1 Tax=Colwellia sp. Bg11-28 TaxID=2058305 RepID=UPI000C3450AF|nr:flagellar hook protein FlgE [Colwellia sp. Bg11-28]PKH88713.1 flagellar hook protein FlgE [Colwellia sp. Bg11-28]
MSFNIALSGLNAAQKDLDVSSNNIANVNTVGFKESRAEFVDVYASSLLASGKTKVGDGVLTADVAQQFSQGSIQFTNNALDLAITGNGFFATVPELGSLETSYTRAGQFKLNSDNFVVNSQGGHLLGFPVNPDGSSASVSLSTAEPIRIPTASGAPTKTSEVDVRMNLPAGDSYITSAPANFDPEDPLTFNNSTSVTIFDSLGDSHIMTYFFVKDDPAVAPNQWMMFASVDGKPIDLDDNPAVQTPADALVVTRTTDVATAQGVYDAIAAPSAADLATLNATKTALATAISATTPVSGTGTKGARLTYNSSGDFISQSPSPTNGGIRTVDFSGHLPNGADPTQTVKIDFNLDSAAPNPNEPTQFASNFEVTALNQDGLAVGRLTGIDIGVDGLVRATYSNGTSQPLARIAMVNFANEQGLSQTGSTNWKESIVSGEALAGEAGSGTFGTINSSALEQSNVNLTTELIDLISAQRNFQANSRALEVDNQLNQTILQIR